MARSRIRASALSGLRGRVPMGALVLCLAWVPAAGCRRSPPPPSSGEPARGAAGGQGGGAATAPKAAAPRAPRPALPPLAPGSVYVFDKGAPAAKAITLEEARAAGMLVVDLSDAWAPFIFHEDEDDDDADAARGGAGAKKKGRKGRRGYRKTFVDLANERVDADGKKLGKGEHNFLEPFGIPPTLSVLRRRVEQDLVPARLACVAAVDVEGLRALKATVGYMDQNRAKRDHDQALRDSAWLAEEISGREQAAPAPGDASAPPAAWPPGDRAAAVAALGMDAKLAARIGRTVRGEQRIRAVRAAQARLGCEKLLLPSSRFVPDTFDLATHEALAAWERKNDIFGWGFLADETLVALTRPALELNLDTFRRVLAERVADAAGIVEDGTATRGKRAATYRVEKGAPPQRVPNLVEEHVTALLGAISVASAEDMVDFLRQQGPQGLRTLHVAFPAPPLPPYYGPDMELSVEIDRGDVWYDLPFDAKGRPVPQHRERYPQLTLTVEWNGQKIPLCRWRTTIGSWRSELHANGRVYYKYKNSDVGPRLWRHIVAGPVWIPPDGTPAKDLLTRKILDRNKGPEVVVNTDVMGPGFQSAYGLVMAIHVNQRGGDNQIRTHGSVDYTSIARRYSHGCHRLVNNRAVRMFGFMLRHRPFRRMGQVPLSLKRKFTVDEEEYSYQITTRGTYFELVRPVPVMVTTGNIKGQTKKPIVAYVPKPGVDYSDVADSSGDVNASVGAIGGSSVSPHSNDE